MSRRLSDDLPASFQSVVHLAVDVLSHEQVIKRLWSDDHRLWKPHAKEIVDRLGWLASR
ncbi:MAG: hypothetical protein P0119_00790 [Nitrospira sp.]|nr:hypothetical protein [Nitrospira sp.]